MKTLQRILREQVAERYHVELSIVQADFACKLPDAGYVGVRCDFGNTLHINRFDDGKYGKRFEIRWNDEPEQTLVVKQV